MRVISGRFKGLSLPSVGSGTRPTTDRTKEALFSHLDAQGLLDAARVLDLYAGTGALGIEALSRGARELIAVEASGRAVAGLNATLSALRGQRGWAPGMAARALRTRAEAYAQRYRGDPFDVIFIDPPYALSSEDCEALLRVLAAGDATREGSVVVLERSTRSRDVRIPEGWQVVDQRHYGETAVWFLEA
jgi:16S rRNA (guanine966-N2)-methyltransferase